MRLTDTTLIEAPVDVVWQLTIDVEKWPSLTSTMQSVERLEDGPLGPGSSARVKQPAQPAAVWTVTRFEPGREFAWRTVRRGLAMTGVHLLEGVAGGCRNTLVVDLDGPLARPFGLLLGGAIRRSLRTENAGFKTGAERQYR